MKQIRHTVDEYHPGLFPAQGLTKAYRVALHVSKGPLEVFTVRVSGQSFPDPFGIAVFAAVTDFGAAGDGVPGGVGPFDFGHGDT